MFARKLAWRYIKEQKRHSILTVCSIAAALMLITLLFTTFSTVFRILYEIEYDITPYHVLVSCDIPDDRSEELQGKLNAFADKFREEYGTVETEYINNKNNSNFDDAMVLHCFFEKPLGIGTGRSKNDVVKEILFEAGFSESDIVGFGDKSPEKPLYLYTTDLGIFKPIDSDDFFGWVVWFLLLCGVVLLVIMVLRLLIDTAFEISSKEREKQFGILQSVGAAPKQITLIMTYEALMLSVVGIPIGTALGLGASYLIFQLVINSGLSKAFFTAEQASKYLVFHIEPLFLLTGAAVGLLWVMSSAYGTGLRIIKKMPVEAINSHISDSVKTKKPRKNKPALFEKIFGWTAMLASRNNMRRKKRFIISVVSLTASLTLFASVTTVLSGMENYFEDMDTGIGEFEFLSTDTYAYEGFPTYNEADYEKYGAFSYNKAADRIRESKLFTEPMIFYSTFISVVTDENTRNSYDIVYVDKTAYEHIFSDVFKTEPPVSYEELTRTNSYIYNGFYNPAPALDIDSIKAANGKFTFTKEDVCVTLPSPGQRPPIRPEYLSEFTVTDTEGSQKAYTYRKQSEFTMNIAGYIEYKGGREINSKNNDDIINRSFSYPFIGSIDAYENGECYNTDIKTKLMEKTAVLGAVMCDLIDPDDYHKAEQFFNDNRDAFCYFADNFESLRKMNAIITAANVAANSLMVLFTLIAVINMVNVLSTGVINRRAETASLLCVGMSEKQLNKMTFFECLQYVFISGICSLIMCEIFFGISMAVISAIGGGYELSITIDDMIKVLFGSVPEMFITPLLRVAAAVIPTFAAALLASFIPLRKLKKQPLVEQIRSAE